MISWERQSSPNPHQTELRTTQGERAQKRDLDFLASCCVLVRNYGIGIMWHIHGFHTLLWNMENIYYLLFLIRGDAKPLLPRSPFLCYHTAAPLQRIFPFIDGYSPHGPAKKASWEYWLLQKARERQVSEAVIYTSGMKTVFCRGHVQQLLPNSLEQTNNLLFFWKSWLFTLSALICRLELASFGNFCVKFQNTKAKALPSLLFPVRFHLPSFSPHAPFHPCVPSFNSHHRGTWKSYTLMNSANK